MGKIADRYFEVRPWAVLECGFDPEYAQAAESIFSLGNEHMGVRGYFEEGYSGDGLEGSYIGGVYERRMLPKSGYRGMIPHTEFMVNSVDWLHTRIRVNGMALDLAKSEISGFERELDLRTGVLTRSFLWRVDENTRVEMAFERFLSMPKPQLGGQRVTFRAVEGEAKIDLKAGLDFSRPHFSAGRNFWNCSKNSDGKTCRIAGETVGTRQKVRAYAAFSGMDCAGEADAENEQIAAGRFAAALKAGEEIALTRVVRVERVRAESCPEESSPEDYDQLKAESARVEEPSPEDYDQLKAESAAWWARQWAVSDIEIEGDEENQQGIRYCVFQLHQTLHTAEHSAIIGAKGLTGEAYNGNAFWDTEVYCLPFYLFNNPVAARSLLKFRYETLPQAKERARALDCRGAFYPIATISGTECCDLWQHASLQLQASTGVMYALRSYVRLTGDREFLHDMGAEMLVEICRMLASRGDWSPKGEYGFYGVMGPDEFQMMVHHNAYTNFMAKKCFEYTLEVLEEMRESAPEKLAALTEKIALADEEPALWRRMAGAMRIPMDPQTLVIEQHDGFFNLPHLDIAAIPVSEFPLYSHWSYERIYRNDMLKQPDVLMFMLLFSGEFSSEQLAANFDYYEPRCIHESSLSPSVHSILAAQLGYGAQAYRLFQFAARLDLDNYNRNTHEGLHITSISGSWMNIVYGFGGLRSDGEVLKLAPSIPEGWTAFSFRLKHLGRTLNVRVTQREVTLSCDAPGIELSVYGEKVTLDEAPLTLPIPGKC
jgi:maltose phosphorylase